MKAITTNLIYLVIPMFLIFPFYVIYHVPFFALCGACYSLILLLIVPGMGEDSLNYRTKSFNPTYRVTRQKQSSDKLVRIIMLVLALVICVGMTYLEIKNFM